MSALGSGSDELQQDVLPHPDPSPEGEGALLKIAVLLLLGAFDAGVLLDAGVRLLSPEDQEVVDNLELLENMDSAADFDLLNELTVER